MSGKPRTKFITIIAQSIYRFKSYPSDDEYHQVVQELLKEWPFLGNKRGNVCYYVFCVTIHTIYIITERFGVSITYEDGIFKKAR